MNEDRYPLLTREQAIRIAKIFTGQLLICHVCCEVFPPATLVTRGTIEGGGPRRFCMECRSQERNYAFEPSEECEYCGIIRKKLGSRVCSAECAEKLAAFEEEAC